jgi:hypothetical protein
MIRLFYSYSKKNESQREQLETFLAPLRRELNLESWWYTLTTPGEYRKQSIRDRLNRAEIVVVLVSPEYLASLSAQDELKHIIQRRQEGLTEVLPVILKSCEWKRTALGEIMALPREGKPVSAFKSRSADAWTQVAQGIRQLC